MRRAGVDVRVDAAYASIVYSVSNMIAALPGVVSSTIAGAVIERTGSLSSIFGFAGESDAPVRVDRCGARRLAGRCRLYHC